jgi:uncharacterized protein YbbK (DUF523 family)
MHKPVIGISSCLLGNHVRYDGGDKLLRNMTDWFQDKADLVAICPEVAIGMGVPRAPIQLSDSVDQPEARQVERPEKIFTVPLKDFGRRVAEEYELDGYIFKSRSPSCGLGSTPVYINGSTQQRTTSGIYTSSLVKWLPRLPVTEAESLKTRDDYRRFFNQCHSYRNLRLWIDTCGYD